MKLSLGEIIRRRIKEDPRTAREICSEVGMTRGNLDKIYKKDAVNTDLLAKLCIVLDYDFFQYVNPFTIAQRKLKGPQISGVEEPDEYDWEDTQQRIYRIMAELGEARKELAHMEENLASHKVSLNDKERLISYLEGEIERLKRALEACESGKAGPN
jgi:DNA-binding Xre family transcriptional regulator